MSDLADALRRLIAALDASGIPFLIGGSMASGVHGIYRTSLDTDLVVRIHIGQVDRLAHDLSEAFYADPDMMRDALTAGRSFNVIHLATSYKFDIFPLTSDAFHQVQFARRVMRDIILGGETFQLPLSSAEDTLLMKLAWYRAGGEVSERQWNDVRGIIAVQGDRLDRRYLAHWAAYLKVADLLQQALELHS